MMEYLTLFFGAALIDVCYVRWFRAVTDKKQFLAVAYSMLIGGCGLMGVTGVVSNYWLAIPWILGLGAGTLIGMRMK